ncbi:MAG TPA: hypothetical protein VLD18_05775 [Verrucomicrobiae bacterium]|nr:hypothetical protein [Verrucomicrobiae bacterium]
MLNRLLAANMRTTIPLLALLCLLAGCVNYPPLTKRVTIERVPDRVLASMVRSQPGAAIQEVELTTHKDRVVSYHVQFRSQDGMTKQVTFDRKGNVIHYQRPMPPHNRDKPYDKG